MLGILNFPEVVQESHKIRKQYNKLAQQCTLWGRGLGIKLPELPCYIVLNIPLKNEHAKKQEFMFHAHQRPVDIVSEETQILDLLGNMLNSIFIYIQKTKENV